MEIVNGLRWNISRARRACTSGRMFPVHVSIAFAAHIDGSHLIILVNIVSGTHTGAHYSPLANSGDLAYLISQMYPLTHNSSATGTTFVQVSVTAILLRRCGYSVIKLRSSGETRAPISSRCRHLRAVRHLSVWSLFVPSLLY